MAELGSVKRFVADPPEAEPERKRRRIPLQQVVRELQAAGLSQPALKFVQEVDKRRRLEGPELTMLKRDAQELPVMDATKRRRIFSQQVPVLNVSKCRVAEELTPQSGAIVPFKRPHQFQPVQSTNASVQLLLSGVTGLTQLTMDCHGTIFEVYDHGFMLTELPRGWQPIVNSSGRLARVAKVALDPHGTAYFLSEEGELLMMVSAVRYLERASSSDEELKLEFVDKTKLPADVRLDLDLDENFSPSTFAPSPAEMATDDEADSIGGKRCARARCPALTALIPDHIIRSTHSVSLNQRDAFADRTCVKDAPEYFTPNQRAIGRAVAFLTTIVLIVQDFLLNRRIFDIIHDDSPVTNAIRKWGRVQLLAMQSGSSEGVVREIVQSMGPDFVNFILCRSFLSFFPSLLQQLMLPEAPPLGADEGVSAGKSKSGLARPAARSDAWPQEDGREGAPPISWILRFLQQRNEAKMQKVTEPELLPLVVPNMLAALTERSRTFAHSLLHKLKVCAAAAGAGCVVYAATLFRGFGKKALLESLASGGLGVLVKDGEESRKKARLAAVLGLLSAGGAIVVGMSFERFNRRPKDPRSLQPSTDRPFEPEREASPPSSEVF
ncbi:unnamed protein product [Symbiodinium necroappetens]|uniref:Uncharacterized protein n=1 Tax=Symbiodinium necroappetens TaxID=1628268 RepID=A0A812NTN0_9DINO|nr:unnamed protein product [Symbiodinium necroappetens]